MSEQTRKSKVENEKNTPWGQVLLLVGAGVVASFQIGKVPPVLPGIRSDLALSLFQVSWVLSIFNVTGLFIGPLAGALADRLGHRRLLLSGLAIQGAGSFIGAMAGSPALLLGTRVLEGLGFLIIATAAPALIFRIVRPDKIRLALGVWSAFVPIGMTLVMLGTPLIVGFFGWRGLWEANALILLGYALFLMIGTRDLIRTAGGTKAGWRAHPGGCLEDGLVPWSGCVGPDFFHLCPGVDNGHGFFPHLADGEPRVPGRFLFGSDGDHGGGEYPG